MLADLKYTLEFKYDYAASETPPRMPLKHLDAQTEIIEVLCFVIIALALHT